MRKGLEGAGYKDPLDEAMLEEVRRLQWKMPAAEEFIVKNRILRIREAVYKVLGFGHFSGGRLPLKGVLAKRAYDEYNDIFS
ncbi:hypothetical protein IMZ48_32565 [Candidatus Bathyarchaeota archaeon]|nr:hypothetical protein [Candidatus Bathyarchaeota archaeon]